MEIPKEIPETILFNEPDGMVRVSVGEEHGWVSSHHLVPTKECQLIKSWLAKHSKT
jgi:hypothetical protein